MPTTLLTYRPQTLKQAKRAYRKSGGVVRLSESEKAAIERRAVLQERADRIKEREARRKANMKKREEKVQREREARHRMGIPTPPSKEGIHVGPSQLHLSGFMYPGVKRKREDSVDGEEKEVGLQKQERPIEPPRSQQSLQIFSPNARANCMVPSQKANANANVPKSQDYASQKTHTPPNETPPARTPLQTKSANSIIQQKSPVGAKDVDSSQTKTWYLHNPRTWLMAPPPSHPPVQDTDTETIISKNPQSISSPTKLPKNPEALPDDKLDDFFVSNTQIQRELSPTVAPPVFPLVPTKPTPQTMLKMQPPPVPSPFKPHPTTNEDTADLLSLISTQDLDFSLDPTQIAAPIPPDKPEISSEEEVDEDGDGDGKEEEEEEDTFPDTELDSIVLEFSLSSPITASSYPSNPTSSNPRDPYQQPPRPQNNSDSYGSSSFDASIQAALQTLSRSYEQERKKEKEKEKQRPEPQGEAAEWDTFELELSTQDLIELGT